MTITGGRRAVVRGICHCNVHPCLSVQVGTPTKMLELHQQVYPCVHGRCAFQLKTEGPIVVGPPYTRQVVGEFLDETVQRRCLANTGVHRQGWCRFVPPQCIDGLLLKVNTRLENASQTGSTEQLAARTAKDTNGS